MKQSLCRSALALFLVFTQLVFVSTVMLEQQKESKEERQLREQQEKQRKQEKERKANRNGGLSNQHVAQHGVDLRRD